MATKMKALAVQLARTSLVPCALFAAHAALAQDAAQRVERVEVTGSNIKRVDVEGPAPIQIITRDDIARSAAPSVGDLLRSLSANTGGSYNESATNNQSGAAGISLRGLGQKSTLVLINGRRMANHAFAQNGQDTFVDLNSIPKSAVSRIEILKDGASAIYGSDAIAGVVNIILRTDYTGVELSASAGRAAEGGLGERNASIAAGFGSLAKDGFNVMAVLDYFHRDRMMLGDRPFLNQLDFRFLPGGSFFPATSGGSWVRPAGVTIGGGSRAAIPNCIAPSTRQTAPSQLFQTGTVCQYTVENYLTAFPEADRLGFFSRGTLKVNANINAFAEVSASENKSAWINQPQTMTNTSVRFNPVTGGFTPFANVIPLTNPISASNPYGRAASLNYTFFDVGARTFDLTTDTFRLLTGLNGNTSGWDWQAAVGTSESKMQQATGNQVDGNQLRLFIDNGGYDFAAPTAAQTEKLRLKTVRNARSRLSFADAKASTELTQLPEGPLGFALGVEARRESLVDTPDPIVAQGRLLGTGSSITTGSRTASAAYFEFNIPALKNLELQAAGRYDRYDDVGGAFSPKVSGKWTPSKEMLVRASYARGFRAPTLVENAASASLGFANVTDPLRANASTLIGSLNVGSTALKAEKSESLNFGFIIEPTNSTSFGMDYYNITQKNLVSLRGAQFIVNNAALFPGAVVRDPTTNFIQIVYDSYSNLAEVSTQGLDFDARLKLPSASYGKFTVRGNASHLLSWRQAPKLGEAAIEYAGRNAAPNGQAFPRNRAKLSLDWDMAGMTATVSGNYTGRYNQKGSVSALAAPTIGEHKTVDLYAAYTGIKNWKFVASVTNLFNTNPPIDLSTGVGPETTLYDLRSRYYRLGVEYKF